MIDDLLENHEIIGKSKKNLIKTLGDDFLKEGEFYSDQINSKKYYYTDNVIYYTGRDFLESLYIIFHIENDIVTGYTLGAK